MAPTVACAVCAVFDASARAPVASASATAAFVSAFSARVSSLATLRSCRQSDNAFHPAHPLKTTSAQMASTTGRPSLATVFSMLIMGLSSRPRIPRRHRGSGVPKRLLEHCDSILHPAHVGLGCSQLDVALFELASELLDAKLGASDVIRELLALPALDFEVLARGLQRSVDALEFAVHEVNGAARGFGDR